MGAWENIKKSLCVWGDLEVKGKLLGSKLPISCDTVVKEKTFGQSEQPGISPNVSRCDHTHGTPPAFNDYFIQTFGGTDYIGEAGEGVPQADIPFNTTVVLMHDGYYMENPA